MTARRILAALLLTVTVVLGLSGTASAVDPGPRPSPGSTADLGDPFFWKLDPGTEFSAQERAYLYEVADRVCEGLSAGVPVITLADGVAAELGVSDTDARHFVHTAAAWRC